MSRSASRRRRARLVVAGAILTSTLVLSACGSSSSRATPPVLGVPASSISVALSQVGCARDDVCVATGTSLSGVGPVATAQFATPSGHWVTLATPVATAPSLATTACSANSCLVAGTDGRADLLWRFDATTHELMNATPPPGGLGVRALSCDAAGNCDLVDLGANGDERFSFSADAGLTWSTPLTMSWASGESVTSVACAAIFNCLVSASSADRASLAVTRDGGVTWTTLTVPRTWTSLNVAQCRRTTCVALANAGSSEVVRTANFGGRWSRLATLPGTNAFACASLRRCVAVGASATNAPRLERVNGARVEPVTLRYVPTGLLNVACGPRRCAAVGATTLVSLPISS
ncbi:MAG: hypothetical protein KGJ10_04585 [Acidobacteriota bacterium]|nr:hypothetical protein [Acidobacteriota bacterium]MDE3044086.1 hypothetical protein [Acidobacteriota bacterium]MDE3107164.1 hypothetical protein [Acidobacteriota bacterium]MDE3223299.1 hypothetical protein [Acidobacteriota bacterium]